MKLNQAFDHMQNCAETLDIHLFVIQISCSKEKLRRKSQAFSSTIALRMNHPSKISQMNKERL